MQSNIFGFLIIHFYMMKNHTQISWHSVLYNGWNNVFFKILFKHSNLQYSLYFVNSFYINPAILLSRFIFTYIPGSKIDILDHFQPNIRIIGIWKFLSCAALDFCLEEKYQLYSIFSVRPSFSRVFVFNIVHLQTISLAIGF